VIGLLACVTPGADTASISDETLAPDDWHILATALPTAGEGDAIVELNLALETRWSFRSDAADGAMGAWRQEDGSTVYARTSLPPELNSAIEAIDAGGGVIWSHSDVFRGGLGFPHGVAVTPAGDLVAVDTVGQRLVSHDTSGSELWTWGFDDPDGAVAPNGLHLRTTTAGDTLLAVSALGTGADDHLALLRLDARDTAPLELWRAPMVTPGGSAAWPHGPRLHDDDTLLICLSALGQVLALDLDGGERWRIPTDSSPLAFPRDAALLPDGSMIIAEAGAELLRVEAPLERFEVTSAIALDGIFSASPLDCAEGARCLGR